MRDIPQIRQVAVLGAGVMGAQIAAHCVNAGLPVQLYDLKVDAVKAAIAALAKAKPPALALPEGEAWITAASYDDDLAALGQCDLVIEAVTERSDIKGSLYQRIAPHIAAQALLVTNTSGLSIAELAGQLPEQLRPRFCGVHFFNPPRYMYLAELVAGPDTDCNRLDALEAFLVTRLGKGVVRAPDTPNFIANRIGAFALLSVLQHAQRLGIPFDVVDNLTGRPLGRPRSATLRTLDLVGLDTFAHVVDTMRSRLTEDPWRALFAVPEPLQGLIARGALGAKSGAGVYRKHDGVIEVYDVAARTYRPVAGDIDDATRDMLAIADPAARIQALRAASSPHAQFLWSVQRDLWHYCACHLAQVADNARDVDLAMRWGYGWTAGPFESWQAAGWREVAQAIEADRIAALTLADVALPAWVTEVAGVHREGTAWAPSRRVWAPRAALPVYARQRWPDRMIDEGQQPGRTVFENSGARCWEDGSGVVMLSFKTRLHTIDAGVLDAIDEALERAATDFDGLVIWQTQSPFSAGANLKTGSDERQRQPAWLRGVRKKVEQVALGAARSLGVADALMAGRLEQIEALVVRFQQTALKVRYAPVPVVAAVEGMALGGGCELLMHCARVVAALDSYIGLVETGLGLIPAGGGCKEIARRAADAPRGADVRDIIEQRFEAVARATVSTSAPHAQRLGYLRQGDAVVMNRLELLHGAQAAVRALCATGYRPPLPARRIRVAGRSTLATLRAYLLNLREGGQISEHDHRVADTLAEALCGGDVDTGTLLHEQALLDLERAGFMRLIATAQTQARIEHMLRTGKPLRN